MTSPRFWTALLLVAVSAPAAGQVFFSAPPVAPAAPVAYQPVEARVEGSTFLQPAIAVRRSGSLIELVHEAPFCFITCPVWHATVDLGRLPAGTYTLRTVDVGNGPDPVVDDETTFSVAPSPCGGLCLLGDRFTVTAEWRTLDGDSGAAQPLPMTATTGAFWFFADDNVELMVKTLDACAAFGRYWFFAAGLTDVGVTLHVRDNVSGAERTYETPAGQPFQPLLDTAAFGCS